MPHTLQTLAFGLPGHWEWIVLLLIGLLLFGRRLPEVGRSLGRSIVEFKKGIKGIEDEIDQASSESDDEEKRRLEGEKKGYAAESRSVPQGAETAPPDPPPGSQQSTA